MLPSALLVGDRLEEVGVLHEVRPEDVEELIIPTVGDGALQDRALLLAVPS